MATASPKGPPKLVEVTAEQILPDQTQKQYVCLECQRSFQRKDKLTRHVRCVHEKLRPYLCPFCELTFNRRDKVRRHVSSVHLKEKPFQCNHCDFANNRKDRIRSHVTTVHGTSPDDFTVQETVPYFHK